MLNDKTILITGGTGSFGKNFVRYILDNYRAKKIIVFSRDELKQSKMREEMDDKCLRFFLGDVRDLLRLQRAFHGVDIVVHAAALKQVPTLEYNPFEAVKTNILGSQNVIEAAIDQKVGQVLFISTDKAVQPVNLYGSTKLCAEKLFVNGNSYSPDIKSSCVRYGNVVGSRGSVVEAILKDSSNPKTGITDERMTRFWITLRQAFELVTFALENMAGGEIFVPKIPSMKIVDLFEVLAPGVPREVTGIRPGEKLHETLLTEEEARHAIELEKYFVILPEQKQIFNIEERFQKILKLGRPLPSGFRFTSDGNSQWLREEDVKRIVQESNL